jgi:hypothetical protein
MTKLGVIFDFLNYIAKAPKIFCVTSFHFYACSQRNCERQLSIPWNFMLGDFIKVALFQGHHMSLLDFMVSPPDCSRSVTDVWSWDAHVTQLRCPGEVDGLNLSSTKLPRPWSPWESSPSKKNPHGGARNRTRDLIISSQKPWPPDHAAAYFIKVYWHIPICVKIAKMEHLTWSPTCPADYISPFKRSRRIF